MKQARLDADEDELSQGKRMGLSFEREECFEGGVVVPPGLPRGTQRSMIFSPGLRISSRLS